FAACGLPQKGAPPRRAVERAEIPLVGWAREQLPYLREVLVAVLIFFFAADVSVANVAMPVSLRWERRPEWMTVAMMYPHIYQSWSMFSPDAPKTDSMIYADAVTRDGRHVDPYNEVMSRVAEIPIDRVPVRLGHDSFACDYTLRIPDAGVYHGAFTEWVLRYPERTGNPNDAITKFDAYVVEQDSPKPEETEPKNFRKRVFLHWP
ncbi:MAG TPA: hypothetical protein VKZ18_00055, partial [Polyangia bacterium]|nr:hypothetical protein [Polyangia bacterium]